MGIPDFDPNISPRVHQLLLKQRFATQAKHMQWSGFSNFKLQDRVITQDIKGKTWSNRGTVIELVPSAELDNCSFSNKLDKGPIIWKSAWFLRFDLMQFPQPGQQKAGDEVIEAIKIICSW